MTFRGATASCLKRNFRLFPPSSTRSCPQIVCYQQLQVPHSVSMPLPLPLPLPLRCILTINYRITSCGRVFYYVQVSRQTRIEVVTEGLFIRRILEDPELKVKMPLMVLIWGFRVLGFGLGFRTLS